VAELEEFNKWRAEVCQVLKRLGEQLGEAEELHRLVEHADWRTLPRALARMTALALFAPELRRYLPNIETAERWMEAEKAHKLEVIRKYAGAAGEGKVVVEYRRYCPLSTTYEYFDLLEYRYPGLLPIEQPRIEGMRVFDHRTRASITVVDREEFLKKYEGKRLMAVVHIVEDGREEYFIEELYTEELLLSNKEVGA